MVFRSLWRTGNRAQIVVLVMLVALTLAGCDIVSSRDLESPLPTPTMPGQPSATPESLLPAATREPAAILPPTPSNDPGRESAATPMPGIVSRIRLAQDGERLLDFRRDPVTGRLFLTSTDGKLFVLDGETFEVIAQLALGGEMVMDVDGRRLYLGPGNQYVPPGAPVAVQVVDVDDLSVVGELAGVHSVALDPAHNRLFAGSPLRASEDERAAKAIHVYQLDTLDHLYEIDQQGVPTYNPYRDELLITAYTVFVVDPDTGEILGDLLPELSEQPFPWCNGCDYATGTFILEPNELLVLDRTTFSTGGGPGIAADDLYLDAASLEEVESFARRLPLQPACSTLHIPILPIGDKIVWQRHYVRTVAYRNFEVYDQAGALSSVRDGLFATFVNPWSGQAYVSQGYVLDLDSLTPIGRLPNFCLLDADRESGILYGRVEGDLVVIASDGGLQQRPIPTEPEPLPAARITQILVAPDYPNDPILFVLQENQRLYRSQDGGQTWMRIQGGLPTGENLYLTSALSPSFSDDRTMYAGGFVGDYRGEGVLRSIDGGETWQPVWDGLEDLRVYDIQISPDFASDNLVRALSVYQRISPWERGASLHESTNRGETWTRTMTAADENALEEEIAATQGASPQLPIRIVEFGRSLEVLEEDGVWRPVDLEQREGENVLSVVPSPNYEIDETYYALGDYSLWRTTDNGMSWSRWRDPRLAGRQYDNALTALGVSPLFADGSYRLFVGTNSGEFWTLVPAASNGDVTVLSPTAEATEPAPTGQPSREGQANANTATPEPKAVGLAEVEPPQGLYRPGGALASVWEASPQTQDDLGWALSEVAASIPAAYQLFEHGTMLWDGSSGTIVVLFEDGTWRRYADSFEEGEPEFDPSLSPPGGGYQPIRGFGKLWRNEPSVRDALGWAIDEERGYTAYLHEFERGWLFGTPIGTFVLVRQGDNDGIWR